MVLIRSHLWTSGKAGLTNFSHPLLVGIRIFPLILSPKKLLQAETLVVWVNISSKETLKSSRLSTCAGRSCSTALTTSESPWASHAPQGRDPAIRILGYTTGLRSLWKCTQGARGRTLAEWDYLASWALLVGLGGAESPPAGPWLRASEGTLRVLRREEKLQEHGQQKGADSQTVFS